MPNHHPPEPDEITGLLRRAAGGNPAALDDVAPLVYQQLCKLAHARLLSEAQGHTLDTAALVHEAWLRVIEQTRINWQDRHHFYAVVSQAMRRVLVDYARNRSAAKRGSGAAPLNLELAEGLMAAGVSWPGDEQLLALDESLDRLAHISPEAARIVQYRFFGGLSNPEVAELLGTSERSVRRSWTAARAWLRRDLTA